MKNTKYKNKSDLLKFNFKINQNKLSDLIYYKFKIL